MKRLTILFSIVFLALISLNTEAQIKLPKAASSVKLPTDAMTSELVKALKPGDGLDISTDNLLNLEKNNKSFVNDLIGIFGGSGTDDEKKTLALEKQTERKNFISNLLGKGKATQYYQLIKPQVEPLIKKYAIAKFLM